MQAESFDQAVASAIDNVLGVGADLVRVEPDPLVSLSDIAARVGVSGAAVSLYAKGKRGARFPAPVAKITDDRTLWLWPPVARWFYARRQMSEDALIEALVVKEANDAIASGELAMAQRLKQCAQAGLQPDSGDWADS
ncbi:hypothetical protein [Hoeflea ulvae]|uniref:Transcriptional regulator n=1 Tax=Hoeflea ulvae TaxID=2983764 RepID=A0ABT3YCF7_9HYPH|nr:hypothetical protein [Hoeflea ulvae]MCY0093566.1 hypothetical protein [Hoeflea ulvae]